MAPSGLSNICISFLTIIVYVLNDYDNKYYSLLFIIHYSLEGLLVHTGLRSKFTKKLFSTKKSKIMFY